MNRPRLRLASSPAPLDELRTELVDLAFALERQGRLDAADLAIAIAGRLGEVGAALDSTAAPPALVRLGGLR